MGIRYGRVACGSEQVEWIFVSHCECDGIGGYARLLRERGAILDRLPETKHSCKGAIMPLLRLLFGKRESGQLAKRSDWGSVVEAKNRPSEAVSWHLFTEEETQELRARSQREGVTVNSFLLKHLDQAIRPEIQRENVKIPWLIPVNMRGDIQLADDTENHVSCVDIWIAEDDSSKAIQHQILKRLESGEHRANGLLLGLGKLFSHETMVKLITKNRARPAGSIGSFSNLGGWDTEKKIENADAWLFCPPVVSGQLLGAGCVTFQNRLGLAIQGHADLSAESGIAANWMKRWVDSLLAEAEKPSRGFC